MTSQNSQIQSLINTIDEVLGKSSLRLPWVMSGDSARQQQVLEQARDYLVSLQQQTDDSDRALADVAPSNEGDRRLTDDSDEPTQSRRLLASPGESAQQVLQAVVQEMDYLRSNMMQPLREDVVRLHQQREALLAEVRHLEAQRREYGPPQAVDQQRVINEFLRTLMEKLQEHLTGQVVQTLADLEARSIQERQLEGSSEAIANLPRLSPRERLEHIQMLQSKSDELMLKLDSTMGVVFESLQKNIESYQDSLGQGLGKMHSLGQQGEIMFAALINRLARQLGQEASSYLRSSLDTTEWELPGLSSVDHAMTSPSNRHESPPWRSTEQSIPDQLSDDQIDQFLGGMNTEELARVDAPGAEEGDQTGDTIQFDAADSASGQSGLAAQTNPANELADLDREDFDDLDSLDLDIDNLDLQSDLAFLDLPIDLDDQMAIFQFDDAAETTDVDEAILSQDVSADDGIDDSDDSIINDDIDAIAASLRANSTDQSDSDALDLLNQITAELRDEESSTIDEQAAADASEPEPTLMGADTPSEAASPENLYHEFDAFYENLDDERDIDSATAYPDETPEKTAIAPSEHDDFLGTEHPSSHPIASDNDSNEAPVRSFEDDALSEQTLENFLFDESLGAASPTDQADATRNDLLHESDDDQSDESIETIASLTDLVIDFESDDYLDDDITPPSDEPNLDSFEREFIAASPDENLLVVEDQPHDPRFDLQLDESTLQQLTTDLSQLEGLGHDEISLFEPELDESEDPALPLTKSDADADVDVDADADADISDEPRDVFESAQAGSPSSNIFADLTASGTPATADDFLPPDDDFFTADAAELLAHLPEARYPSSEGIDLFAENYDLDDSDDSDDDETLIFSSQGEDESLSGYPTVEDLFTSQDADDSAQPVDPTREERHDAGLSQEEAEEDDLLHLPDRDLSLERLLSMPNLEDDLLEALRVDADSLSDTSDDSALTLDEFSAQVDLPADSSVDETASVDNEEELNLDNVFTFEPSNSTDQDQSFDWHERMLDDAAMTESDEESSTSSNPRAFGNEDADVDDRPSSIIEGLDSLFEDLVHADRSSSDTPLDGQTLYDLMTTPDSSELGQGGNLSNEVSLSQAAQSGDPERADESSQKKKNLNDETDSLDSQASDVDAIPASHRQTSHVAQRNATPDLELATPDLDLNEDVPEARVEPVGDRPDQFDLSADTDISTIEQEIASIDSTFINPKAAPPPPPTGDDTPQHATWFLGIDFGTTGLSAVLLNRQTCELHPIYWTGASSSPTPSSETPENRFRLPTLASLLITPDTSSTLLNGPPVLEASPEGGESSNPDQYPQGTYVSLRHFKPYLNVGIPYHSAQTSTWEPVLQWTDQYQVALSQLYQTLQLLLNTLGTSRSPLTAAVSSLSCGAVGLEESAFQAALQQLAGVIMGQPDCWSDTYRFNVREAVLGARLVARPEQVMFIDDAIATILSGLRGADGRSVMLPSQLSQQPHIHNTDWNGYTLAINAGASTTEFALVNLPDSLHDLTYQDFTARSIAFGGDALDQDIVCQLLYPPRYRANRQIDPSSIEFEAADLESSEQISWDDLRLETLELPNPGQADLARRYQLRQRLDSSPSGKILLDIASRIKFILQHQKSIAIQLGDEQWVIPQQDLGSRVFVPFIQRLHHDLIDLLRQSGGSIHSIRQVICSGGSASLRIIAIWLRQKLPQATIIQDTYTSHPTSSQQNKQSPTCSRVAYGLATLPLHPTVMEPTRRRYNDYFLLLELLRSLPNQPLTVSNIMQILESRGIDPQICYAQVLALLEGQLPAGFVPTQNDFNCLTAESHQNPDYRILLAAPLFHKKDYQTYQTNIEQCHQVRRYLNSLTASARQKLTAPILTDLTF
ncbi:MAG: hypothetical protein ACFE0I_20220 [Elainellaceae cyanobacterium]